MRTLFEKDNSARLMLLTTLIAVVLSSITAAANPPEISIPDCKSAIVMEVSTGDVVYALNADEPLPPASMVKMMLIYLTLKKVHDGEVSLDDVITTSAHASRMGGSQVYLKQGEQFTLREMLKAVMIQSANDAGMAIAEYIGGGKKGFVDMMNAAAAELGMKNTIYRTPHGLPPSKGQKPDLVSARDLAILAREIILNYPEALKWSGMEKAEFRDGKFMMTNTNHLIRTFPGCDGLKTGYYTKAGFGVTATASQRDIRVIAVVMGCKKSKTRFEEAARLLRYGLDQFKKIKVVNAGTVIDKPLRIQDGVVSETFPITAGSITAIARKNAKDKITSNISLVDKMVAPVKKNVECGSVAYFLGDRKLGEVALVTAEDIPALSWWGKLLRWVHLK